MVAYSCLRSILRELSELRQRSNKSVGLRESPLKGNRSIGVEENEMCVSPAAKSCSQSFE